MNWTMLYDIVYALAARDGRDKALFGTCAPTAHEAFTHSMAGNAFPELWFELPLLGDPWFDLHCLTARKDLDPSMTFDASTTGGYPEVFAWFANQGPSVRQLALSYDVSKGVVDHPAVQLLIADTNYAVTDGFLQVAGRPDAVEAYQTFVKRLPKGWYPCYTGVFPGRLGERIRVECIPNSAQQRAYASDPDLFERDLRQTGYTGPVDTLVPRCQAMADTPFQFELQFDVTLDGAAGGTISASLRFDCPPGSEEWRAFEPDGAAGELMRKVEGWGLADDRWRLLADTAFAKRASFMGESVLGYCFPAFVKLKWHDGEPLDAKTYLMAGVE